VTAALLCCCRSRSDLFSFLLARHFDYPKIRRNPAEDFLSRFHAAGVCLKLVWCGFMPTAVILAPLALGRDHALLISALLEASLDPF
jgi:hypothetical protein